MEGATVNPMGKGPNASVKVASLARRMEVLYVDGVVSGEPRSVLLSTKAPIPILNQ